MYVPITLYMDWLTEFLKQSHVVGSTQTCRSDGAQTRAICSLGTFVPLLATSLPLCL